MNLPPVSVIIVSRGRPDSLIWCLRGIAGLRYPEFEVIVVADPEGIAALGQAGFGERVKAVEFDEANISVARNQGIAQAAGEIVAFIDDDAVPEPTWLRHLVAPFASAEVMAVGGFVRGRNGISFQWKARSVDAAGRTAPLQVDETRATVLHPSPGRAIKTEGTNMALRRDILAEMGGFDPGFRFYLDETDMNLRLAEAGHATAIAPLAQVHHAYAASARRGANRAVRDLSEIGASIAVFLRKHCPEETRPARCREIREEQRRRALRQMVAGLLEPRDVRRLMASLERGYEVGLARKLTVLRPMARAPGGLLPFGGASGKQVVLSGRRWSKARLWRAANAAARQGATVSLFLFSPDARYHRVRFTGRGVWEQTGGLFGRSDRDQPLFRLVRFSRRVRQESARVDPVRGISADL